MRRHFSFECNGAALAATLDKAADPAGLLWVGGGNEIRSGAFAGQAQLAARIAAAGFPVLRFDRRGVGDSDGENLGFRSGGADIAAAVAAFRSAQPHLTRIVAFGNCDAASALMLTAGSGADTLILANPWTFDAEADRLQPTAVRARYAAKLADPDEWMRLASGKVSLRKLAAGLMRAGRRNPATTMLAREMADGLARFAGQARILIAERDRTGQAFLAGWNTSDPRIARCAGASHAFVEGAAREWLLAQLLEALADEQTRQLDMG